MKALSLVQVILFLLAAFATQPVWAASSISTRVKVVEEKIRLHDKKLRELAAQQELTKRQVESLRLARETAEKEMAAKAELAKQASIARAVASAKAKHRQEVEAKQADTSKKASSDIAMQSEETPATRYAFP